VSGRSLQAAAVKLTMVAAAWRSWWPPRCKPSTPVPPTGARAPWRRHKVSPRAPFIGSGRIHQLKPHLAKSFKLSRDPKFLEKLTDVVGVYLTPPQNAVVLCVDEKSQIQALDRTQPGLPMKPGRCGTFTHDYERHGTTRCLPRYKWLKDASSGSVIHAIVIRNF
jgi:hypothetical protein